MRTSHVHVFSGGKWQDVEISKPDGEEATSDKVTAASPANFQNETSKKVEKATQSLFQAIVNQHNFP